ncbi:MAG: serine protease, partial [Pseudonocardia sp.]
PLRITSCADALGALLLGTPVAPAAAAAPTRPPWAPADTAPIRPGVSMETAGAACTSNFVFTSGDRTFLGQAAHCAGTGAADDISGCTAGSLPLGTPVTIRAADGTARTGTLAYSSWLTMQQRGEIDPDLCQYNDFALVEIAGPDVADVNPSIPFFGGPTGLDTDGLQRGEHVYAYGNSPLRQGIDQLGPQAGLAATEMGAGRSHQVYVLTPGVPGDSGSAYLDHAGNAVGVLSTLNFSPMPGSNGVSDLAQALDYATTHGGVGPVELAPGTRPFDPGPADEIVDKLRALATLVARVAERNG